MPNWRRRQRGGWRHYARHENKMRRMRSFLQAIFPKQGAGKKVKSSKLIRTITILKNMKSADRSKAIRQANDKFIKDFCSIIKGLRYKKLTSSQMHTVRKYKKSLSRLVNSQIDMSEKRQTLSQKGGFLGAVLGSLVIPALAGLLTR